MPNPTGEAYKRREVSLTEASQKILNFVRDFMDEKGRIPKFRELSVSPKVVIFHFDSYENLIRIARIGEKFPLRKNGRKKRYCRYVKCKKLLPRHRWFFCNDECEAGMAADYEARYTELLHKRIKREKRKMWSKCRECQQYTCKIYLPEGKAEPPARVICKTDPEYQEMSNALDNKEGKDEQNAERC